MITVKVQLPNDISGVELGLVKIKADNNQWDNIGTNLKTFLYLHSPFLCKFRYRDNMDTNKF